MVCYAAIQFMLGSAEYFNAHPIAETDFYFVQRLSSLARVVVVGMAALGSGVTGGAAGMTRRPAPRWWPPQGGESGEPRSGPPILEDPGN